MQGVYICDDHPLYCKGIALLLEQHGTEFCTIGMAHNGHTALEEIDLLKPDIVLLDLNLPGITGLQLLQQLRNRASTPLVIALTSYNDATLVRRVQDAGGNAYLLKDATDAHLLHTLRHAKANTFLPNPHLTPPRTHLSEADQFVQLATLTQREREVIGKFIVGLTAGQVAAEMNLSEHTVRNYRKNIYRKLKVGTIQELILYCKENGLLD